MVCLVRHVYCNPLHTVSFLRIVLTLIVWQQSEAIAFVSGSGCCERGRLQPPLHHSNGGGGNWKTKNLTITHSKEYQKQYTPHNRRPLTRLATKKVY